MSKSEPGFLHQAPGLPASGEPAAPAPDAGLDKLLAEALESTRYSSSVDGRERRFQAHHRAALAAHLRRHLAAWAAAQRAEAELLRRVLGAVEDACSNSACPLCGADYPECYSDCPRRDVQAVLARPRPSASGLLGLLSELRQDGAGNQPYRRYARVMARRLAAKLGLGEEGDAG